MQGLYLFLGVAALLAASFSDIKTREVPDWLNYSLIISGVSLHAMEAIIFSDVFTLLNSIIGVLVMFAIALLMFYGGQWGGGDSKLLIGLGALIGFDITTFIKPFSFASMPWLFNFLMNLIFIGVIYGVFWSISLAIRKRKKFSADFKKRLNKYRNYRLALLILLVVFFCLSFFTTNFLIKLMLLIMVIFLVLGFYIWLFAKSVENSCLLKYVEPEKLTEGDWIAEDLAIDLKKVLGNKGTIVKKTHLDLIHNYYQKIESKIEINRKILFFVFKMKVKLASLEVDDIPLSSLYLKGLKIIKNKRLDEQIIDDIHIFLRKHVLLEVKVKRKILFFNKFLRVAPKELKSGDVLLEEIRQCFYLAGPGDLGIERKQIDILKSLYKKGKIKKILIKEGIPFVPSFFIAYIVTILLGNLIFIVENLIFKL